MRWLTLCCAFAWVGCADPGPQPDDDDDGAAPAWEVVQQGLDGAILSIWGSSSDDLWLAGAGPTLLHRDAGQWSQLDSGAAGDLWWVYGAAPDAVWMVGEGGTIIRYDRAAGTFTAIAAPTTATLFGAWGPPGGPLYAVGGSFDGVTPPVLVRVDDGVARLVTGLPAEVADTGGEAFFKVWGSAADDVWVIGDHGSVLHFDGTGWALEVLPGRPRLVTVHGAGAADVVVVGGTANALIFQHGAGGWADVSPEAKPALNGVFVSTGGRAAAAGFTGTVLARGSDGAWSNLPAPEVFADWHSVWIDEDGAPYIAGGTLSTLSDGVVVRFVGALPP